MTANSVFNATPLADDLLTGAEQIAAYLGWPVRKIYHARRQGHLPIRTVGAILIARKSELDRVLSALEPV